MKKIKPIDIVILSMFLMGASLIGCSLKSPHDAMTKALKIFVDHQASDDQDLMRKFASLSQVAAVATATPSAIGDFNCFAINVTGGGLPSNIDPTFSGCTSGDNLRGKGFGIFSAPKFKSSPFVVDLPFAATGVNVDVYGIYPSPGQCGGTAGLTERAGYYLGGTTVDALVDSSITIPTSYSAAAYGGRITCSGGGAAGTYKYYVYLVTNSSIQALTQDNATGTITLVNTTSITNGKDAVVTSAGDYLILLEGSASTDLQPYTINKATGDITSYGSSVATGTNSQKLFQNSSSSKLWTYNNGGGVSMQQYTFASGTVTSDSNTSSLPSTYWGTSNSAGSYVVMAQGGNIQSYTVTGGSALSPFSNLGAATPSANYLGLSGGYLYWADNSNGVNFSTFSSGNFGVAQTAVAQPAALNGLLTDPNGKFLLTWFASNTNSLVSHTINSGTGVPTPVSTVAVPTAPTGAQIDSTGSYVFIWDASNLRVFSINQTTGVLTLAQTYPISGVQAATSAKILQ